MSEPIFYDTETIGFYGLAVLIQYAEGDDDPELWPVFKRPPIETMDLIAKLVEHPGGVVGFNLAFDHFHLSKLYTTLSLVNPYVDPEDQIEDLIEAEYAARDVDTFLKPRHCLDLMLHAQKGPYQSMMDRKDISIRRVPRQLAFRLADELNNRIKFKDIYFARRKTKLANPWTVKDIKDQWGDIDPDFKDITIAFAPSRGLKTLVCDALNIDPTHYKDVDVDEHLHPFELGYAPCAKYIMDWKGKIKPAWKQYWRMPYRWTWPAVAEQYTAHWYYNPMAQKYAANDVIYTRKLYEYFNAPPMDDDDSVLACSVASCRWHGYTIDVDKITRQHQKALAQADTAPTSPAQTKKYIISALSEEERIIFGGSTRKTAIEELAEWTMQCPICAATATPALDCQTCGGKGLIAHPAASRAKEVLEARTAEKQADLYGKLIFTGGRFHASFKIIGAKSSRMSGTDGFNPQGVNKLDEVRECFVMAHQGQQLFGGDFDAFEVGIADAVYKDPDLHQELLSGRKIHATFGTFLYEGETYNSIKASSGSEFDMYKRAKSGLFAWIYGGTAHTLRYRLAIPEDQAERGIHAFENRFRQVGISRAIIVREFSPLRQPKGVGSAIDWHEPPKFKETLFGFKRYFDVEYMICKALYDLGQKPPNAWRQLQVKVQRDKRDTTRVQTASGAVQSALFGAAFGLQGACARAALNHEIQGTGSGITKGLQRSVWDHQPIGINKIMVQPLNVHDEVLVNVRMDLEHPTLAEDIYNTVQKYVKDMTQTIPLIKMKWEIKNTWAA